MEKVKFDFRPIDRSLHEVLVVDDDPANRYATARMLRNAGFRTCEAATGGEALLAAEGPISVMLLDVHLPDIDGFELCRLLRSDPATNRLPVLHLTAAYVSDEDKVRGLDSGADAYLTHPVEPAVLVATVQALVRTRVAEDAMRRSEAKFHAIYEQAPGGISLLDEHGCFLDANPAMLKFLGRAAAAIVGRPVSDFVPPEWIQQVDAYARDVETAPASVQFPVLDAAGRSIDLEWCFSPHIEPRVNMAVSIDVSQRALLEQQRQQLLDSERVARGQAEQLNRMKDDFIAVLSHELKTPLNAILGWAHILQKRGGSEETMRGLSTIERNGRTQARMITDLLDMSRLNLGKLPLTIDEFDPADAVVSAVNAMKPATDENENEINVELDPPYRTIRADASRLQQVIWNLLSNATKFSPRGGKIRVALLQEEDGLRLRVSDEGQGIAPEFLPLVFDRFSQSVAATNRQRGGLGLGLSIVKQLVEAHGGTVSAASGGAGKGTSFEVWLPATPQLQEIRDDAPATEPGRLDALQPNATALDGLRVLLVDDDPDATGILEIVLGDRGAAVDAVHDCDAALRLLEGSAHDLLISDIGMPGKSGYDLIRELRSRESSTGRHLPAMALTSFTRAQDQQQVLAAGFDAHCSKPVQPLEVMRQIGRLMQRGQ